LKERRVLVVGGGRVGGQKAAESVACGARVTVVSPLAIEEVQSAAARGELVWEARRFRGGDTAGFWLIVAATDEPATNDQVFREASAAGTLVNVCDDPSRCSFIFASKIERGPLTVSVFTHGTSPALSRRVRREVEGWLGPEYGLLAELLAELRPQVMAIPGLEPDDRRRLFERLVYSELLYLFREGEAENARALAALVLRDYGKPGLGAGTNEDT
jgi:precorrin-2 dehydrogenase/sirohydrochlorin ferrochelatase